MFLTVIFAFPILVYLALSSNGFASPTPDLASELLQLTMFVILVRGIGEWLNGQRNQNYSAGLLVVLAATSVTVKLSNLVYAVVIFAFVLIYTWVSAHQRVQGVTFFLLPAAAIILVYCLRGYVLSGAPLYPSTIGYIPFEWAVPKEL